MNTLGNLKIGTRLGAGFAVAVALLIAIAAIGISRLNAVDHNTDIIVHDRYAKVAMAHAIENAFNAKSRALRTALLSDDAAVASGELAKVDRASQAIAQGLEQLQPIIHTDQGKAALQTMMEARRNYLAQEQRLLALIKAGRIEEGRHYLVKDILPVQAPFLAAIEAFAETQVNGMNQFGDEAAQLANGAINMMYLLAALAALLAAVMGYVLTRSIVRPLAEAVRIAETVAAGDLSSHIDSAGRDETGQLMRALMQMNGSLVRIVGQVRDGTEAIASASGQIASGNQDLSSRTEQQAGSLEETASSMEELTSTVRQNADNARQANGLAVSASEVARKGGVVVAQVVGTMGSINESSRKIVDIIGVIDGIAFQTNILALNAAVEAARAGEQGRGFAVVASEVRNLAQRSAAAAKEIKGLIDNSVEQVTLGSKLVDQAGATMGDIVASIQRVTDIMGDIAAASMEQGAGIEQVNQAITQMDQVTQQNAALVEEAAEAAVSLQEQADSLLAAVSVFKLHETTAAAPVRKLAPAEQHTRAAVLRLLADGGQSGAARAWA